MKRNILSMVGRERRAGILSVIIVVQTLCALFFIADVVKDIRTATEGETLHFGIEAIAALSLVAGVLFLMVELRRILIRLASMDDALMVARGQLAELVGRFFEEWHLTPAEREVAVLVLKGFDNDAIAGFRNTARGTVRAQTASIYAKSGTDGRAQFVSHFMEELMAGELATLDKPSCPPEGPTGKVEGSTPVVD
jgi:DNA-binding CsgD family transcriptional regulator